MLVSPICNDQFHQAYFLERSGAGKQFDLRSEPVAACRAVLASLIDPESLCRGRAQVIRDSYRAHDGAREAARLVAELA